MTKIMEAGATPRRFDVASKNEALRMWMASGQAAELTARALGIAPLNDVTRCAA